MSKKNAPGPEEGSCQLLPPYHIPLQVTVGRLPRDFPHSRFRGSDALRH